MEDLILPSLLVKERKPKRKLLWISLILILITGSIFTLYKTEVIDKSTFSFNKKVSGITLPLQEFTNIINSNTICNEKGLCQWSSEPIAVYKNNQWNNINTSFSNYNQNGYDWKTAMTEYEFYVKKNSAWGDGIKYCVNEEGQEYCLTYQAQDMSYRNQYGSQDYLSSITNVQGTIEKDTIIFNNTFPNTTLIYSTEYGKIKELFILNSKPKNPQSWLGETNQITLDYGGYIKFTGLNLSVDGEIKTASFTTNKQIDFVKDGKTLFHLPKPYAWDSNGNEVELQYEVKVQGSDIWFYTRTPYNFLESAVYPVYIDPTVSLTGTSILIDGCIYLDPLDASTNDYDTTAITCGLYQPSTTEPKSLYSIEFNITSVIPTGYTPTAVEFNISVSDIANNLPVSINNLETAWASRAGTTAQKATALNTDARDGLRYVYNSTIYSATGYRNVNLGSLAVNELKRKISVGENFFGFGVYITTAHNDALYGATLRTRSNSIKPILKITYMDLNNPNIYNVTKNQSYYYADSAMNLSYSVLDYGGLSATWVQYPEETEVTEPYSTYYNATDTNKDSGVGLNYYRAQTFTPLQSYTANQVCLTGRRNQATASGLTLELKEVSGLNPTGSALANVTTEVMSTTNAQRCYTLGNEVQLYSGTKYAIVYSCPSCPNTYTYYLRSWNRNVYSGGEVRFSGDSGLTWSSSSNPEISFSVDGYISSGGGSGGLQNSTITTLTGTQQDVSYLFNVGGASDTAKVYTIFANDTAGNTQSYNVNVWVLSSAIEDTTAPTGSIISPINASRFGGIYKITANVQDETEMSYTRFQYYSGGWLNLLGCEAIYGSGNIECNADVSALSGETRFRIVPYDLAGNYNESIQERIYTIDNDVPSLEFVTTKVTYPNNQVSIRNTQELGISINATDLDSGVKNIEVYLLYLNGTGSWFNLTFTSGSKNPAEYAYFNNSFIINTSTQENQQIEFKVYDNSTPSNILYGSIGYNVDNDVPTYSATSGNTSIYTGESFYAYTIFSDNYKLKSYIFENNYSGTWTNISINFTGASYESLTASNQSEFNTSGFYSYRFYVYDDAGNSNVTELYNITVSEEVFPLLDIELISPNNEEIFSPVTFYYNYTNSSGNLLAESCSLYVNDEFKDIQLNPNPDINLTFEESLSIGEYVWQVKCNVSDSTIFDSNIVLFNVSGDTTSPYFTTIPADEEVVYGVAWDGVQFNATDETLFDSYSINDTTNFIINSTGFLNWTYGLGVGNYYVNVTINDSSNNLNSTIYNLNVTSRAIEITADDKSKTYGGADPVFTNTITSGSLAYSDSITGDLTRDAGESAGTYNITQGTLTIDNIGNYSLTFVNGTFTINKATSSVYTYLNNSRSNITIEQYTSIWLNGTLETGLGNISLYINESLNQTEASPLSVLHNFSSSGVFNVSTIYPGNENYTSAYETFFVNVTAYVCVENLQFTDWSAWGDLTCINQTHRNQSRSRIEYDSNDCGTFVNVTHYEYQAVEDSTCDTEAPTFTNCRNFNKYINNAFSETISATDPSGIDSYVLNDTGNFSVSSAGLITNATIMNETNIFNLNLTVNDTTGKIASCVFYIDYKDTPVVGASNLCRYKKLGIVNSRIPFMKEVNCI